MKDYKLYKVRVDRIFSDTVYVHADSDEKALSLAESERVYFDYEEDSHKDSYEIIGVSNMSRSDKLDESIRNLSTEQKIQLQNAYCDVHDCEENKIMPMSEIEEFFEGCTAMQIIKCCGYSFYDGHDYFYFDGGYIRSMSKYDNPNRIMNIDGIVIDIENGETYGLDFIKEMLEEK